MRIGLDKWISNAMILLFLFGMFVLLSLKGVWPHNKFEPMKAKTFRHSVTPICCHYSHKDSLVSNQLLQLEQNMCGINTKMEVHN